MQDQYVGDVGDFGKYGLLRLLCDAKLSPALRLGVVWYRVSNELGRSDGKFINYLDRTSKNERRFRACDPELWDTLQKIVCKEKKRTVEAIQTSGILPATTRFFSRLRSGSAETDWLSGATDEMRESEVVFLDPDNGLQVGSVGKNGGKAGKYVFFDHILTFLKRSRVWSSTTTCHATVPRTRRLLPVSGSFENFVPTTAAFPFDIIEAPDASSSSWNLRNIRWRTESSA